MPDNLLDTAASEQAASLPSETGDANAIVLGAPEQVEMETLDDLLSNRGRFRLREMADVMKESGALRIKDHRTIQGNNPDTFKGEYARDWILKNEKLVNSSADAIKVAQAMLDLNIFHSVNNNAHFDSKNLYAFDPENVGGFGMLKNRIVAIEDHNIAQTKANKEAQAEAVAKTVQLDWRVSVAERRLEAVEGILRRSLVVQQVVLATLLVVLLLVYAPIWPNVAVLAMSLVAVLLVVVLLESRSILRDFLCLEVDYKRIANGIMGIMQDDDEDGLSSGRLESQEAPCEPWLLSIQSWRGTVGDAMASMVDAFKHAWESLAWRDDSTVSSAADVGSSGTGHEVEDGKKRVELKSPRITAISVSSATRLINRASGRFCKVLSSGDRSRGLRRQSAPVLSFFGCEDTPVWNNRSVRVADLPAVVETKPVEPQPYRLPFQHTAPPGPPSERDFEDWWNVDLVVRQPAGEVRLVKPVSTRGRVRVNYGDCHAFDGPLFSGRIMVWIKGLPLGEDSPDVFHKLKRRTWVIVQGRFKERVPVNRVYTGQAFKQPLEMVPRHLMKAAMMIVQSFTRFVSSASIVHNNGAPVVMYPLILGAQSVNVAEPGSEPDIADIRDSEDVRLLTPKLTNAAGTGPATEAERRAYFSKDSNRQATIFDPAHVYTFHVRQHIVDVAKYRFPTSLGSINLLSYLKGQPLRFMAVDVESEQHLWNLEAWHRLLLHSGGGEAVDHQGPSHVARASFDSLPAAGSETPVAQPTSPTAASFASDSPFEQSSHGHTTNVGSGLDEQGSREPSPIRETVFQSCSFRGNAGLMRHPSGEAQYSAVSISVPNGASHVNSSGAPTPKPFTEQANSWPPLPQEQHRGRMLLPPSSGNGSLRSNGGAANLMFTHEPASSSISPRASITVAHSSRGAVLDSMHDHTADVPGIMSETASETAPSSDCDLTDAGVLSLGSVPGSFVPRPSSRASNCGNGRRSVSKDVIEPVASGPVSTQSVDSEGNQGTVKKSKKLKNPFRRRYRQ